MSFSVDWNEWQTEWQEWRQRNRTHLRRSGYPFPDKNFMADEVLGTYKVGDDHVELSEVTFPDLSGERRGERKRYIGITWGTSEGLENGGLVDSFEALEEVLGLVNH